MGSISGIDISSLLSALGSTSSGINVSAAVAQAIYAMSAPQREWQNEQITLRSQTAALNAVQSDVQALQTSLNALGDPAGALTSMAVTSTNSNIVSGSALSGTAAGNHVVVVNNLATTASWYSSSVASSSTPLSSGSFTLQVGSGSPVQIQIGSGVNTLDQLASYINGQNLGVSAGVVNDSSGSRLAIISTTSGAAADFSISGATGLTFTQAVAGKDAALTVDGIPIDSASNTVTGVVNGLTLNLLGAAAGTQVNVAITPSTSDISQAVTNFVNAYNTVMTDINSEYTLNSSSQEGALAGDSVIRMLQNTMLSSGSFAVSSGAIATLGGLGIRMANDGTLSVDNSTLTNAIQNNLPAVQSFLQGASSNGFVSFLNNQLNSFTDATSGAFTVDLQSISNQNTGLQNQINDFQDYLSNQQTILTNQYNQADILMQQLPQQIAQINAELGLNNNNNNSGCWIAAELYDGWLNPRTVIVRNWLNREFKRSIIGRITMSLYLRFGEQTAQLIRRHPGLKSLFRPFFDAALRKALAHLAYNPIDILRWRIPQQLSNEDAALGI